MHTVVNGSELVGYIKSLLGGIFTMDNLIYIIGGALALGAGFVVFHFGYKYIKKFVYGAMFYGRFSGGFEYIKLDRDYKKMMREYYG